LETSNRRTRRIIGPLSYAYYPTTMLRYAAFTLGSAREMLDGDSGRHCTAPAASLKLLSYFLSQSVAIQCDLSGRVSLGEDPAMIKFVGITVTSLSSVASVHDFAIKSATLLSGATKLGREVACRKEWASRSCAALCVSCDARKHL
jgi:hypothetical protein